MGGKRAGQLQDLVGPMQILDFAFQILDPLRFVAGDAFTHTPINFDALDPFKQCLRHAANLWCDRFDCCAQRRVLPTVLLHYPHSPLTDLG